MIKKTSILTAETFIIMIIMRLISEWLYKLDGIVTEMISAIFIVCLTFLFCKEILKRNLKGIGIKDINYKQLIIITLSIIIIEKVFVRYFFPDFFKFISLNDTWIHFFCNMLYKLPLIFALCYSLVKSYSKNHSSNNKIA